MSTPKINNWPLHKNPSIPRCNTAWNNQARPSSQASSHCTAKTNLLREKSSTDCCETKNPPKDIKFINRNDVLVYVDDEICNKDALEKRFTIITTTEAEWNIFEKLFKNNKLNYKNTTDARNKDYNDDVSTQTNDSEDNCNCNNAFMGYGNRNLNNRSSSPKCNEKVNTRNESGLNRKFSNQKTCKSNDNILQPNKTYSYSDKDFITRNILLASIKCPEIKKSLRCCDRAAYTKCNKKPCDNENIKIPTCACLKCVKERQGSENTKKPTCVCVNCVKERQCSENTKKPSCVCVNCVKERQCSENTKKPSVCVNCVKERQCIEKERVPKCSAYGKRKSNVNPIRKSSPCAQKSLNSINNSTFCVKGKISIVPPDPPERPIYVAHRPTHCNGVSRPTPCNGVNRPTPCNGVSRPTPCNGVGGCFAYANTGPMPARHDIKQSDTTYRTDYAHPIKRNNSVTSSTNCKTENFVSYNNQRPFIENDSPIRLNAVNMEPHLSNFINIPLKLCESATTPYM